MAANPPKKVRRVRVIEVIDDGDTDEDLEEVLEALDRADKADKAGKASEAAVETSETEEAEDSEDSEAGEDAEPASETATTTVKPAKAKPKPKTAVSEPPATTRTVLGAKPAVAAAVVVVVAALATLSLVLWRSESGLSSTDDDRKAITKLVTDYGNVVLDYDRSNLQASVARTQTFLTGEALTKSKQTDVEQLKKSMDEGSFTLSSTTRAVYVGNIEGRFAGAVLVFDISVQGASGANVPANHLTVSLVKGEDGKWLISQQKPAGSETDGSSQVPGLNGGTTPSSSASPSASPSASKD